MQNKKTKNKKMKIFRRTKKGGDPPPPTSPANPIGSKYPTTPAHFKSQPFWNNNIPNKIMGTVGAIAAGTIAVGVSPAVVFGTTVGSGVVTYIGKEVFQENPVGVTATIITPIAEVLRNTGIYTNIEINIGANFILNSVDSKFSENHYFDINEQNGATRVGTIDQVQPGDVIELGPIESIVGLVNGVFNLPPVTNIRSFIHDITPKTDSNENSNLENVDLTGARSNVKITEGISLPTAFSDNISLQDIISQTTGEIRDTLETFSTPINTEDLLNANRAAAAAAREALNARQPLRDFKGQEKINEFNERGAAIADALNRLKYRTSRDQATVDEFNTSAQARINAKERISQRENEAENVSTIAQIMIDQMYYDSMPEYQNQETPINQQYDPRYGQAYINNLERVILNSLNPNVRSDIRPTERNPDINSNKPNEENIDFSKIGDLSAITAITAYVTRGFIGKLFRVSENKKNKKIKKKINKIRIKPQINNNILELPEESEDETIPINPSKMQFIPIIPERERNSTILKKYSNPTYGEYFIRPVENTLFPYYSNEVELEREMPELEREMPELEREMPELEEKEEEEILPEVKEEILTPGKIITSAVYENIFENFIRIITEIFGNENETIMRMIRKYQSHKEIITNIFQESGIFIDINKIFQTKRNNTEIQSKIFDRLNYINFEMKKKYMVDVIRKIIQLKFGNMNIPDNFIELFKKIIINNRLRNILIESDMLANLNINNVDLTIQSINNFINQDEDRIAKKEEEEEEPEIQEESYYNEPQQYKYNIPHNAEHIRENVYVTASKLK